MEDALDQRTPDAADQHRNRHWPGAAERIRQARQRVGLKGSDVAQRLGMTVDSYYDLELHPDEAFTCVSLRQLRDLGHILGVPPGELLLGSDGQGPGEQVPFSEIVERLRHRMYTDGVTADQLGDRLGWDIRAILLDPEKLWDFNIEGLYDTCKTVGVDWVAALPALRSTP